MFDEEPSNKLVLQHEMFILDANLIKALNQSQMHKLIKVLKDEWAERNS